MALGLCFAWNIGIKFQLEFTPRINSLLWLELQLSKYSWYYTHNNNNLNALYLLNSTQKTREDEKPRQHITKAKTQKTWKSRKVQVKPSRRCGKFMCTPQPLHSSGSQSYLRKRKLLYFIHSGVWLACGGRHFSWESRGIRIMLSKWKRVEQYIYVRKCFKFMHFIIHSSSSGMPRNV